MFPLLCFENSWTKTKKLCLKRFITAQSLLFVLTKDLLDWSADIQVRIEWQNHLQLELKITNKLVTINKPFDFVSICSGSGKSTVLIEMIINLIQSKVLAEKKKIKILVTGSQMKINDLTWQLHKKRTDTDSNIDAGKCFLILGQILKISK